MTRSQKLLLSCLCQSLTTSLRNASLGLLHRSDGIQPHLVNIQFNKRVAVQVSCLIALLGGMMLSNRSPLVSLWGGLLQLPEMLLFVAGPTAQPSSSGETGKAQSCQACLRSTIQGCGHTSVVGFSWAETAGLYAGPCRRYTCTWTSSLTRVTHQAACLCEQAAPIMTSRWAAEAAETAWMFRQGK